MSFWSTAGFSRIGVVDVGDDSVVSMAFSPDSRTLATGNFFTVTLIDPTSKRPAVTVPSQSERDRVYSISFSPDGHTLAWVASGGHNMSASIDGKVVLWDVERGVVTAILPGQTGLVNSVAFSPDSQILASGDGNGVTLWSVPQRSRMTTLGEKAAIVTLAFVSNGSTLVAGERNGSIVRFWNVDPKTWTDAICGVVGREMTAEEWATYLPGREQIALCG